METRHYLQPDLFEFKPAGTTQGWRRAQRGALSSVLAHWTVNSPEPALVSIPTGSGKTAVATALPYLASARRVLVLVPSSELRKQTTYAFEREGHIRSIGARTGDATPEVLALTGRATDWESAKSADVVIATPNSISPGYTGVEMPGTDYFDLVIVDEGHHSPATTWRAVLDYFSGARAVLLTATPRRADGKRLPGNHVYHFPLREAVADDVYQVVKPLVLEPVPGVDSDRLIADAVVATSGLDEHASSAILIRAGTIERGRALENLYQSLGLEARLVTSRSPKADRDALMGRWRDGSLQALISVDLFGEGIDLPRLRICGYHDKHKSVAVTMQFIGRLARVSDAYPQDSTLITVREDEAHLSLKDALRHLYSEDADWSTLLPGLIDDEIEREKLDDAYLSFFGAPPTSVRLSALSPLARAVVHEVPTGTKWRPEYVDGTVPEELAPGATFASQTVVYSGLNETHNQLVVITKKIELPRWYVGHDGLGHAVHDLHVVSWHPAPRTDRRDLLFVNTKDQRIARAILALLDPQGRLVPANPRHLQSAFDSVERASVSSVGVRSTFAGVPGTPAYAMFAGSGIDRGLRESDTNSRALGHAMAQVQIQDVGIVTAGLASFKRKYWETRYIGLREYELFSVDLASRYWEPRPTTSGPLLPEVAKGQRTDKFPDGLDVIAAEFDPGLYGQAWRLEGLELLEALELRPPAGSKTDSTSISLEIVDPARPADVLWRGSFNAAGVFQSTSGTASLNRGSGQDSTIHELLTQHPPTIYLLDGSTVVGSLTYPSQQTSSSLPALHFQVEDWLGCDVQTESKQQGRNDTIHDYVEALLSMRPPVSGTRRWILCNDGHGEIADHIVIEHGPYGRPRVELWHSKAAKSKSPGVRVTDLQVVTQQAAKSRRHFTDRDFWARLGRRLAGTESPALALIEGSEGDLRALCGLDAAREQESLAANPPSIDGEVVVVQPGLSIEALKEQLIADPVPISAGQVREFLIFLHNSAASYSGVRLVASA